MARQDLYKSVKFSRLDIGVNRVVRSQQRADYRRELRSELFALNRPHLSNVQDENYLSPSSSGATISPRKPLRGKSATQNKEAKTQDLAKAISSRLERLKKWREDRNRQKIVEKQRSKPIFKPSGVVHHKIYSPLSTKAVNQSTSSIKLCKSKETQQKEPIKRITRATEKRLATKGTSDLDKKVTKLPNKKIRKRRSEGKKTKQEDNFIAPKDHQFKAPKGVEAIPLFGRQAIKANEIDLSGIFPSKEINVSNSNVSSMFDSNLAFMHSTMASDLKIDNSQDTTIQISRGLSDLKTDDSQETTVEISSIDTENSNNLSQPRKTRSKTKLDETGLRVSKRRKSFGALPSEKIEDDNLDAELQLAQKNSVLNRSMQDNAPKKCQSLVDQLDPVVYSPFVVSSRGKSSARKEQKKRLSQISPKESIPTKENVMQNLNISIQDEEKTAQYYRFLLDKEIERLRELCNKWNEIKEGEDIIEDVRYVIQQAVGQTDLLLRKKFERFRSLVADCETGKGEMLVTCKDLQGFWEMMYMEVVNCEERFNKLEILKSKNWIEEEVEIKAPIKKVKKTKVKDPATTKAPASKVNAKPSSLRAVILAARQKKLEENKITENRSTPKNLSSRRKSAVSSIKKPPKTPEPGRLDESRTFPNSNLTPAKGILKRTKDDGEMSSIKSSKSMKVLFKNSPMEVKEFDANASTSFSPPCQTPSRSLSLMKLNSSKDLDDEKSEIQMPKIKISNVCDIRESQTSTSLIEDKENEFNSLSNLRNSRTKLISKNKNSESIDKNQLPVPANSIETRNSYKVSHNGSFSSKLIQNQPRYGEQNCEGRDLEKTKAGRKLILTPKLQLSKSDISCFTIADNRTINSPRTPRTRSNTTLPGSGKNKDVNTSGGSKQRPARKKIQLT